MCIRDSPIYWRRLLTSEETETYDTKLSGRINNLKTLKTKHLYWYLLDIRAFLF